MATQDENEELSLSNPILGSLSARGKKMAEIIAVISLCLTFTLTYVLWRHSEDARAQNTAITTAIQVQTVDMSKAIQAQASALRQLTCIMSLPERERKDAYAAPYSFCNQLAR